MFHTSKYVNFRYDKIHTLKYNFDFQARLKDEENTFFLPFEQELQA